MNPAIFVITVTQICWLIVSLFFLVLLAIGLKTNIGLPLFLAPIAYAMYLEYVKYQRLRDIDEYENQQDE